MLNNLMVFSRTAYFFNLINMGTGEKKSPMIKIIGKKMFQDQLTYS